MDPAAKRLQIKNTLLYVSSVVVNNLIALVTLPVFTRILSREDYGVFALAEIYGLFATGLANFGMVIAYERNYFQYASDRRRSGSLLYSTLAFTCVNFCFLLALTGLFRHQLSWLVYRSHGYGMLLFWNYLADFILSVQTYFLCFYKNSENAKSNVSVAIAFSCLNFLLAFCLIYWLRLGVSGLVFSKLCAGVIINGVLVRRFLRMFPLSFDARMLKESLRLALPLTPRIFLGVVGTKFDQYMIGLLGTLGGVGVYTIGQKVASMVFVYMTSLENVFAPNVYKLMFGASANGPSAIGGYLTAFAYLSISLGMGVVLFSGELIWLLTPLPFHGAENIIIVLALYYGFLFFAKITGMQLVYMKKTHISSALIMATYALNILLNVPFIIRWQAEGAAWATFISGIISGGAFYLYAQRFYPIRWQFARIGAVFLTFLGSALTIIVLKRIGVAYAFLFTVKVFFLALYAWLGVRLGVFSRENFQHLRKVFVR